MIQMKGSRSEGRRNLPKATGVRTEAGLLTSHQVVCQWVP